MSKQEPSYEDKVEELETILKRLDDASTPIDRLAADVKEGARLIKELDWQGRLCSISAIKGEGTRQLAGEIMVRLEEITQQELNQ